MYKRILSILVIMIVFLSQDFSVNALSYESRTKTTNIVNSFISNIESKITTNEKRIEVLEKILKKIQTIKRTKAGALRQNQNLSEMLSLIELLIQEQILQYKDALLKSYSEENALEDIFGDTYTSDKKVEVIKIVKENFTYKNGYLSADDLDPRYNYFLTFYETNRFTTHHNGIAYYPGKSNYTPTPFNSTYLNLKSQNLGIDHLKTGKYNMDVSKKLKNGGTVWMTRIDSFVIDYNNPLDEIKNDISVKYYKGSNGKIEGNFTQKSHIDRYEMSLYRDYYSGEAKIGKDRHYDFIDTTSVNSTNAADAINLLVENSKLNKADNRYKVFIKGLDNNGVVKSYGKYYFSADASYDSSIDDFTLYNSGNSFICKIPDGTTNKGGFNLYQVLSDGSLKLISGVGFGHSVEVDVTKTYGVTLATGMYKFEMTCGSQVKKEAMFKYNKTSNSIRVISITD